MTPARTRGLLPDRATGASDRNDLAGQGLFLRRSQFCLLKRPVLDIEHVGVGDRTEPADRLGIGDHLDIVFVQIGRDVGSLRVCTDREEPDMRYEQDARHRVQPGLRVSNSTIASRIVEIEIVGKNATLTG